MSSGQAVVETLRAKKTEAFRQDFQHAFGEQKPLRSASSGGSGRSLRALHRAEVFMPISLAIWFNSAMDIACSWLMLMVFAAVNSAPGAPPPAQLFRRPREVSTIRSGRFLSCGLRQRTSSGNPSINSSLFALPLGRAFFWQLVA